MIVRHDRHERRPDDVEDGEVAGMVELVDAAAFGLANRREHGTGIGDGACHHLAYRLVAGILGERRAAIDDELTPIVALNRIPL
jgi:hypothetical protein